MKKVFAIFLSSVVIFVGAFASLYFYGYVRFNYPDKSLFPVNGIDISHHQGQIDWNKLKHEDIRFVYIKATEGGDFKDHAFKRNWQSAKDSGMYRGAYHFFTFCTPGKAQAINFVRTVPNEPNTIPPVIDFEYGGNCKSRPPKEVLLKEVRDYVKEIERAYGKPPIFYTTYEAYNDYLQGEIDTYELWIRDIFRAPHLGEGRSWTFWQYAHRARVAGIKWRVDLNVFNGSKEAFMRKFRLQEN
jgi:lysozyme